MFLLVCILICCYLFSWHYIETACFYLNLICILLTLCVFVFSFSAIKTELQHGNTQQQILAQIVGGSPILGFRYNTLLVLYFNLLLSFQLALHRDGMFLFNFVYVYY